MELKKNFGKFCLTLNNLEKFCVPSVFGIIIYHYVKLLLCCTYDKLIISLANII